MNAARLFGFQTSLILLSACLLPSGVHAQPGFEPLSVRGQFRDALIDEPGRSLYVAVYDRNEVLRIDLDTGEVADTAQVEKGPVALALSHDRATLVVVNRLSNNLSVLSAADLSVVSVNALGEGPTAIVSLPPEKFAIVNTYDDTLSIVNLEVDVDYVEATEELDVSVPNVLASSNRYLAVGARVPPSLIFYDAQAFGGLVDEGSVALEASPTSLAFVGEDHVAVATKNTLSIIAVPSGRRLSEAKIAVSDIVATEDKLLTVTKDGLREFDFKLVEAATTALPDSTRAIAASSSLIVAFSPKGKSLYLRGVLQPGERDIPAPIAPVSPAPSKPLDPTIEEAEPVSPPPAPFDEPETQEAETLPAESSAAPQKKPVFEGAAESDTNEIRPRQGVDTPQTPTAARQDTATEESESAPEEAPIPEPAPISRTGLPADKEMTSEETQEHLDAIRAARRPDPNAPDSLEPRAPYLSDAGESLVDNANVSIREALAGGMPFSDPATGFVIPDREALEGMNLDIVAKGEQGALDWQEDEVYISDDVEIRFGNTLILADAARAKKKGDDLELLEATGNVQFSQENAQGTADRLQIKPAPSDEERDSPRSRFFPEPEAGEGGSQPARGYFEANNLYLDEPSRELDAEFVQYDLSNETGEMRSANGRAGIFYWGAENLRILGPDDLEGEDVWLTTCDHDPPHYRLRLSSASLKEGKAVLGTNARLQLGGVDTPLFLPRWKSSGEGENRRTSYSFDSGRFAGLGYFLNVARWWEVTPDVDMAIRVLPTQKEGVGFGIDAEYNFMERPASLFYRSKGKLQTMYTTEDRGYTEFYHRQELAPRTLLLAQYEQWYDRDFVKDFFYKTYRNRTGPRTFVNLTHTRPGQILTATAAVSTHDFTRETEKLPEVSYHLLERQLAKRLYLTLDSVSGYYDRTRSDDDAGRSVNIARLSYDWNLGQGVGITPFVEGEGTWYSETRARDDGSDEFRFSGVAGITAQARFHRAYAGRWGFSSFKHILVPSFTYSYRPDASLESDDTPRLDALDDVPGRSRIEGKIDNIFLGRDEVLDEEWQVARLSFYHGNDFENETRETQDYEVEFDIRPRPWWGFQAVGEHHSIDRESDIFGYFPYLEALRDLAVDIRDLLTDEESRDDRRGDFNRILAYFYYDDSSNPGGLIGRVGFAYTETDNQVFNREVLYGLDYKVNDNWGFAFEHRYDMERDELVRQTYEVRRRLHCWEAALQLRDRESGFDIDLKFTLTAFPGARVKF